MSADAASDVILQARNLAKSFVSPKPLFGKGARVRAVDGVSFDVRRGETLAIVGESGCGKSTLARLLIRLLEADGGEVLFEGRDLAQMSAAEMRALRGEMQIVFQDPFSSLNPRMSAGDIVTEALWLKEGLSGAARRAKARELLALVGLRPAHADRYPHEFSGGQRQRIGIARAIAGGPKLIIGDEPVSALDVSVQAQIINLLEDLKERLALTLVVIAHDLAVIRHMSDRVIVMYLGEIVEVAPVEALFSAPLHPYTQALLAAIPAPDPGLAASQALLTGEAPNPADPPPGCRFHTRCQHVRALCREAAPKPVEAAPGRSVACHFWNEIAPDAGGAARSSRPSDAKARRIALYAAMQSAQGSSPA